MTDAGDPGALEEIYESDQLVLSDLINRVLDKGVVISANIIVSIAGVDLIQLDLRLLVSSVTRLLEHTEPKRRGHLPVRNYPRP